MINKIKDHYNQLASRRDSFLQKNKYFYSLIYQNYQYFIAPNKRVLEIGCGIGNLLDQLKPSFGVGIDISPRMIDEAKRKFPNLHFYAGEAKDFQQLGQFDYIILSGLLGELDDIQQFFEDIKPFCHQNTRIIIEFYSVFWQQLLLGAETLGLKMPEKIQNWLNVEDVINFLTLAGYDAISSDRRILFPIHILGISYLLNKFIGNLPGINSFCLSRFVIARPLFVEKPKNHSVSILVPCRNEKGNIEAAVTRTPDFGSKQEFIFVEGNSKDGTYEEIERVMKFYPNKDIKLFKQQGVGKGDAVRLGFSQATNDILMILDADLTVAPEELPKFYQAITDNHGEFINGSRLVYPMEKEAMRFLNLLANKFFGSFFTWLLGQRFKDTLCGTKVMFRRAYEELVVNRSYFGNFDPFGDFDLIFGATKLNLKIIELPIRYKERTYGTTQIQRFRHGLLLFRMCGVAMRKIKFR